MKSIAILNSDCKWVFHVGFNSLWTTVLPKSNFSTWLHILVQVVRESFKSFPTNLPFVSCHWLFWYITSMLYDCFGMPLLIFLHFLCNFLHAESIQEILHWPLCLFCSIWLWWRNIHSWESENVMKKLVLGATAGAKICDQCKPGAEGVDHSSSPAMKNSNPSVRCLLFNDLGNIPDEFGWKVYTFLRIEVWCRYLHKKTNKTKNFGHHPFTH